MDSEVLNPGAQIRIGAAVPAQTHLLRLNRLAPDLPEVRSLLLDPVLAGPDGVVVSGERIVVGPPTPEDAGPRRLQ